MAVGDVISGAAISQQYTFHGGSQVSVAVFRSTGATARIGLRDGATSPTSGIQLGSSGNLFQFYVGTTPSVLARLEANGRLVVGGSSAAATSGGIDMQATTFGFLGPRLTEAQRDALTAANGMVVWNTTAGKLQVYTGAWADLH